MMAGASQGDAGPDGRGEEDPPGTNPGQAARIRVGAMAAPQPCPRPFLPAWVLEQGHFWRSFAREAVSEVRSSRAHDPPMTRLFLMQTLTRTDQR